MAAASLGTVASVGALGLIILGAAPMAAAQASRNADPILAESIAGSSAPLNFPAKGFQLTDQHGQTVSLASLRGKVVLLTFLDPVCTTRLPADRAGVPAGRPAARRRDNRWNWSRSSPTPSTTRSADIQAFDRQEQLSQVPNWLYLTGSVPQLQQVWKNYAISAEILPGRLHDRPPGHCLRHRQGGARAPGARCFDPGPGTTATKSSFAVLLADAARQTLRSS